MSNNNVTPSDFFSPDTQVAHLGLIACPGAEELTNLINTFHEYSKVEHPEFTLKPEETDICEFMRGYLAERYDEITYQEVLNKDLKVMDSTATALCKDNNIPLVVFGIADPENIVRAVKGEKIGTTVK